MPSFSRNQPVGTRPTGRGRRQRSIELAAKALVLVGVLASLFAITPQAAQAQDPDWFLKAGDSIEYPVQPTWVEIKTQGKLENLLIETAEGDTIAPTGELVKGKESTIVYLPLLHDGLYSVTWTDEAGSNYAELAVLNPANGAPVAGQENSLVAGSAEAEQQSQGAAAGQLPAYLAGGVILLLGAAGTTVLLLKRRGGIAVLPLGLAVAVGGGGIALVTLGGADANTDPVGVQVQQCAQSDNKIECLRTAIFTTYTEQGAQATGELLSRTQKTPGLIDSGSDQPCHTAAHKVGQELARSDYQASEIVNDYLYSCGFGVGHGWLEGRAAYLDDKEAARELPTACDGITDPDIQNACMHGIGHAAGWRYNNEPYKTLRVCLGIEVPQNAYQCAQGAGMNMALGYKSALARDQKFDPERQARNTPALLIQACSDLPVAAQGGCFDGAYTYLISYGNIDLATLLPKNGTAEAARQWCETLEPSSTTYRSCIFGLGSSLVDTYNYQTYDRQVADCGKVASKDGQLLCVWGAQMRLGALPEGPADIDDATREELCKALNNAQECADFLRTAPLVPPALLAPNELVALLRQNTQT